MSEETGLRRDRRAIKKKHMYHPHVISFSLPIGGVWLSQH
jgi:hypothetical protein